jgi:hypothetical protein
MVILSLLHSFCYDYKKYINDENAVDCHCQDVKAYRKETNLSHLSVVHYAAVIEYACSSCEVSYLDTKILVKKVTA